MTRLLCLCLLAAGVRAQTVQGVVLNAATRRPVAGALVELVGTPAKTEEPGDIYRAESDRTGRFRFEQIAPGRYRAYAKARNFLALGERAPHITISAASPAPELSIRLTPAGTISGRITDQDGDPVPFVSIDTLQYTYQGGRKALRSIGNDRTDDRGMYRIFGLAPGRYYVRATMRADRSQGFGNSFYPGVSDLAQANPLELAPGGELRSIDILLHRETLFSITGTVMDADTGRAASSAYVTARNAGDFHNGAPQIGDTFTIPSLVPGRYVLTAQYLGEGPAKTGRIAVDLGAANLTGVTIIASAGIDLAGTVRGSPAAVHLSLEPEGTPANPIPAVVNSKGGFTVPRVPLGPYHLTWNLPKGVYVQSIRVGDRLLPDDALNVTGQLAPLTIQLASDGGVVRGVVRNEAGEPVSLAVVTMAADPAYDFWSETSDESGRFEIRDLAPGNYALLAFDGAQEGAPQDPDFRRQFSRRAVRVQVLPSTQQTIDVVAIPPM